MYLADAGGICALWDWQNMVKYVLMWMKTIRHGMRRISANISSIGIENCNTGSPSWNINQATIDACAKLVADIAKRHGLGKLVVNQNLFLQLFFILSCPGMLLGKLQYIADKANAINEWRRLSHSKSANIRAISCS